MPGITYTEHFKDFIGLSKAIRDERQELMTVFNGEFQGRNQWRTYFTDQFGDPPKVRNLLQNMTSPDAGVTEVARYFQALYIACWMLCPLEKGTFMIHLNADEWADVNVAYAKLPARISSHLHGTGRSASTHTDFFLIGYQELLVQTEGEYLLLKAEGHALNWSHPSEVFLHGVSWVRKSLTGAGATASGALHQLAQAYHEEGGELGFIKPRAAENYSKKYEKLLKNLSLEGRCVDIRQLSNALLAKCRAKDRKYNRNSLKFPNWLESRGLDRNMADTASRYQTTESVDNFIMSVLIPFIRSELPEKSEFRKTVLKSEQDLGSIAESVRLSFEQNAPRYFNEVVLTTKFINKGLKAIIAVLDNAVTEFTEIASD